MSRRCPPALLARLLAALASCLFAGHGLALDPAETGAVDPALGPRVAEAVADAAARLDTMPCALVLSDFVDSRTGRTLAENLALTGRSASEHVRALLFRGAPAIRPFGGRRVFAYTAPSSPVVLLCRDDLLRVQNQRRLLTAVVLHEVLHTLGLREDSPSPVAVTERVLARCF
jgi:hypothetical protein